MMTNLCKDDDLKNLIDGIQSGQGNDVPRIEALLGTYPDDPRLHFLKGSCLAGEGQLIEAHNAFNRAVEIAPDYAIARFQLGFFQLTSGESNKALKTWARLDGLQDGHYLKFFVVGLRHLIRDEFADCINTLEQGIKANQENPPLNNDMQLIIDECSPLLGAQTETADTDTASATSILLGQFTESDTQH